MGFQISYSDCSDLGLPRLFVCSGLGLPSMFVRSVLGLPSDSFVLIWVFRIWSSCNPRVLRNGVDVSSFQANIMSSRHLIFLLPHGVTRIHGFSDDGRSLVFNYRVEVLHSSQFLCGVRFLPPIDKFLPASLRFFWSMTILLVLKLTLARGQVSPFFIVTEYWSTSLILHSLYTRRLVSVCLISHIPVYPIQRTTSSILHFLYVVLSLAYSFLSIFFLLTSLSSGWRQVNPSLMFRPYIASKKIFL